MTSMSMLAIAPAALMGAIIGSFAATAGLRAAAGRSAIGGRSMCDGCGARLSFAETAPLASYVLLKGRCGGCHRTIHPAHPASELAGALAGSVLAVHSSTAIWPLAGLLAVLLIGVSVFDVRTLRIPDMISASAALLAIPLGFSAGRLLDGLVTGLATFGVLSLVRSASARAGRPPGLGLGDVKLMAALSIWTGVYWTPLAITLAATLGLAWTLAARHPASERLPFAPFIAIAYWGVGMWSAGS